LKSFRWYKLSPRNCQSWEYFNLLRQKFQIPIPSFFFSKKIEPTFIQLCYTTFLLSPKNGFLLKMEWSQNTIRLSRTTLKSMHFVRFGIKNCKLQLHHVGGCKNWKCLKIILYSIVQVCSIYLNWCIPLIKNIVMFYKMSNSFHRKAN